MPAHRHSGRSSRSGSRGNSDGEEDNPARKAARVTPAVSVLGGIGENDEEAQSAAMAGRAGNPASALLAVTEAAAKFNAAFGGGGDDDEEARSATLTQSVFDLTGDAPAAAMAAANLNAACINSGGTGQGEGEGERNEDARRADQAPTGASAAGAPRANAPAQGTLGVTADVLDARLAKAAETIIAQVDQKLNHYLRKTDNSLHTVINAAVQVVTNAHLDHFEARLRKVEGEAGTFAASALASASGRSIQLRHAGGAHGPAAGTSSTTCWGSIGTKPSAVAVPVTGQDPMESA